MDSRHDTGISDRLTSNGFMLSESKLQSANGLFTLNIQGDYNEVVTLVHNRKIHPSIIWFLELLSSEIRLEFHVGVMEESCLKISR